MTPDGQLLSSDSFQLLTSDGRRLLQGEDVHALLSPPVLLGNSPPTVQQQAVDQLLLGSVPVAPQPADHVILEAPSSAPSPTDNILLSSTPTLARSADPILSPPTSGAIMSVNQFSSSSAVVPCPAAHPTAGNPLLESSQLSNGGTLRCSARSTRRRCRCLCRCSHYTQQPPAWCRMTRTRLTNFCLSMR